MIFDITIKDTDVLESEDEDEETEGNTPTKDQANQQSTSDEDSGDESTPMNTPQSRPTQPEKMTPMAKGGQVVLVCFSRKDLDIFKAPLFEDNGGSFIGSHQHVTTMVGQPRVQQCLGEDGGKEEREEWRRKVGQVTRGEKAQLINILRKTIIRGHIQSQQGVVPPPSHARQ